MKIIKIKRIILAVEKTEFDQTQDPRIRFTYIILKSIVTRDSLIDALAMKNTWSRYIRYIQLFRYSFIFHSTREHKILHI